MSWFIASAFVRAAAGAALLVAMSAPLAAAAGPGDVDPRHIVPPYDPRLDAVRAPAGFGTGQIWHVGPNEPYKKPSEIVSRVHDGDIVEVDAAHYACDTGVKWAASDLTIVGVGGRPVLDATHCTVNGDKGIWNPVGKGLIVDNFEFLGAAGPSQNDAGIRYDGTGYVLITNCYIHDNEDGILATPGDGAATDFVIDHSDFDHNGTETGSTHNIYISSSTGHGAHSFVIRFSYSHGARVGHQVKTRALTNYILYNRLADEESGDSSYAIDISNGGLTYIIGNVIQHGPKGQNWAMVSYASEGGSNPVQEVYVASNTFVSEIPNEGIAMNLYDHGLTAARMVNNLVVGVKPASLVGVTPSKITLSHNVITSSPGFYDEAHRNYHLTAHAPAIGAGVDPGSVHGMPLAPAFEFEFPATGVPRPSSVALDAGAYQYEAGQVLAAPPAIQLSAKSPVDYDTPATLTWNAKDALYCSASGDWSGSVAPSGRYTSSPLTSHASYALACTGPGGSASRSLDVAVNESPEAAKLGTYLWHDIPGSALKTVCASDIKDSSGKPAYADDFGTGPYCEGKGNSAIGVYVPTVRTWYLLGGNGGRNYYGNEVYGFDVATLKPELVTLPDHISDTEEYAPGDLYGSKVHIPGCDAILHLKSGGVIRAPSGITNSAAWDPLTGKIEVGPGDFVRGSGRCSVNNELGQMSTDLWSFTPPVGAHGPVASSSAWSLLAPDNNGFGSVTSLLWIFDPATGLAYVASNRAYADRGGFLIDFNETPPKTRLVNASWPYGREAVGPSAVDTDHHYAMVVGSGRITLWNLNGLSMTKYGPKAPFTHEDGWTITGNTDLLADRHDAALTYNPKLKAFVAWTGSSTVYFLHPDYRSKRIDIVAKNDISGGPEDTSDDLDGKFVYIPDLDAYLVFTGVEQDFHFLVPPTSSVAK